MKSWRASTYRTVPDFERMTTEWVAAPPGKRRTPRSIAPVQAFFYPEPFGRFEGGVFLHSGSYMVCPDTTPAGCQSAVLVQGEVTIDCGYTDDGHVQVSVADNGIGIPSEDLKRIFERFYRVDKARSRPGGGTGLGLPIVKEIVDRMGGAVSVESQLGRGSRFTILLQAA